MYPKLAPFCWLVFLSAKGGGNAKLDFSSLLILQVVYVG